MEWRQQTSVSCGDAFNEAQRWMEEVTWKSFGSNNFRAALENGVLLCDLINKLKPGHIKRMNRLSTPIAGLDNVNVFLKACEKLGLNESQLFHPGDLQDLSTRVTLRGEESNRRLKNVLITIYWLGRKAQLDPFYSGPQLNFKAFEGLLGLALSKALEDGSVFVKESEYRECWYPEREELQRMRSDYKRGDSVDSIDSLDSRTLHTCSEGGGSDAEAEQGFRMEAIQPTAQRSKGYVPPLILRRRQRQEQIGGGCPSPFTRSKSLSDIPMVVPEENTCVDVDQEMEWKQDHAQKSSTKDGEAKWQDDLTKWKNRRRSSSFDLLRKMQERDHVITRMTSGSVTSFSENGVQRGVSKSSPASNSTSSGVRPHSSALLTQSYSNETPYSPSAPYRRHSLAHTQASPIGSMLPSDPTILGEETYSASLASDGAGYTTPTLGSPFSSQTQVKAQGSPTPLQAISELGKPGNYFKDQISPITTTLPSKTTTVTCTNGSATAVVNGPMSTMTTDLSHVELSFCMDPKDPTCHSSAVNQATMYAVKDMSHQNHISQEEAQQTSRQQAVEHVGGQQAQGPYRCIARIDLCSGSASLPRGFRRSEGTSHVSAGIAARSFGTKPSRMSSLPRLYNIDDNTSLPLNSVRDGSLQPTRPTLIRQVATSQMRGQHLASIRWNGGNKRQNGEERREKEKRSSHFNLTSCQTNGYPHQPCTQTQLLPQPYSNLKSLHRKSWSLPSNISIPPPKVHHSDMRVSLSLKPNSRPDFGFQTHWDSTGARVKSVQAGSPAELCQLCVDDEIVSVDGITVAHFSYDQWKNTMTSALQNGSLTMDIRRYGNKDWSSSGGNHHNMPCPSRKTLNLTAAASMLIGFPDHHANNAASAETAAMTSSKFNGQNVDGTSGEFADNSKITRSNGGSESAISDLQVPSLSRSSSSWSWDHEQERRRQEKWQKEQERLLQEQYQQDQERLEAEWRRAQQDAIGEEHSKLETTYEMTNGIASPASAQLPVNGMTNKNREDEQHADGGELNGKGVQDDKTTKQDWAEGSCGFAQLSPAHRAKSKSTPALAGLHKQTRGDPRKREGQCLSKAEQERQQILEEMKKRTHLLTDNSWIRQRSTSMYKEPIYIGVPLKRYESLDNVCQSPVSTTAASYSRPHSPAAGYSAPSRNASSRYSMEAGLSQRQACSMDSSHFIPSDESAGQSLPGSQQYGSVSTAAEISRDQRWESRSGYETGSPIVSTAISNLSSPLPPPCDQNADRQILE